MSVWIWLALSYAACLAVLAVLAYRAPVLDEWGRELPPARLPRPAPGGRVEARGVARRPSRGQRPSPRGHRA